MQMRCAQQSLGACGRPPGFVSRMAGFLDAKMAYADIIQLDTGRNTPRGMEVSGEHMNAVKRQPAQTTAKRG